MYSLLKSWGPNGGNIVLQAISAVIDIDQSVPMGAGSLINRSHDVRASTETPPHLLAVTFEPSSDGEPPVRR